MHLHTLNAKDQDNQNMDQDNKNKDQDNQNKDCQCISISHGTILSLLYRTLCWRDQRKNTTFMANSALLTTMSALTVCFIEQLRHSL